MGISEFPQDTNLGVFLLISRCDEDQVPFRKIHRYGSEKIQEEVSWLNLRNALNKKSAEAFYGLCTIIGLIFLHMLRIANVFRFMLWG